MENMPGAITPPPAEAVASLRKGKTRSMFLKEGN
jgi:hypothetical protein